MNVKIKKLMDNAVLPHYAKPCDAGMDLTAVSRGFDEDGNVVYGTGLAMAIPEGYVGLLFPRSSNAKKNLLLCNSVGVVDSGYRGEVILKYKPARRFNGSESDYPNRIYDVGERVGQIIILPYPHVEFEETTELPASVRGDGGFGSTGK